MRTAAEGKGIVLISQPVHQHGYETAVAAQDAGLLRFFVTGIYYTGRGLTSPRLIGTLPSGLRARVERELLRRRHSELDPSLVYAIPRYHVLATGVRRIVDYSRLPRGVELDTWAHLRFDESVGRILPQLNGLRIVHAFEGSALATLRSARRLGITTVLDVTSAQERLHALGSESDVRVSLRRVEAEREAADVLLVPSDYAMRCLLDHGVAPEKILKVPYGVDHIRFSPAAQSRARDEPFSVLYAGAIVLRKGVRYLLEAWRTLNLSNAELLLIGKPDKDGRKLLREFEGHYRWLGEFPKYAVHRCFHQCDVLVLPSLADSWGFVVTEAMASGLPVVCTSATGAPVRDGIDGFVVPARDVKALRDSLRFLYENPEARRELGGRARELVTSAYTRAHYRTRVSNAYRSILSGRSMPRDERAPEVAWRK
jgi:glycosyltransferase involved in cell wall biosynthesis